jgi:hypothetical protein
MQNGAVRAYKETQLQQVPLSGTLHRMQHIQTMPAHTRKHDPQNMRQEYSYERISMSHWWNEAHRGRKGGGSKYSEVETARHSATLYTKNCTWSDLGRNLGLRSDSPTSDRLIMVSRHHGIALKYENNLNLFFSFLQRNSSYYPVSFTDTKKINTRRKLIHS